MPDPKMIEHMTSKSLSELQKEVKACVEGFNFAWSDYVQYIHLVEEVAELGEALTVQQGDRKAGSGEDALADHNDVKEEIGDVLFNVVQIANQLNLNLDEVMERTFTRYEKKLANLKKHQGASPPGKKDLSWTGEITAGETS